MFYKIIITIFIFTLQGKFSFSQKWYNLGKVFSYKVTSKGDNKSTAKYDTFNLKIDSIKKIRDVEFVFFNNFFESYSIHNNSKSVCFAIYHNYLYQVFIKKEFIFNNNLSIKKLFLNKISEIYVDKYLKVSVNSIKNTNNSERFKNHLVPNESSTLFSPVKILFSKILGKKVKIIEFENVDKQDLYLTKLYYSTNFFITKFIFINKKEESSEDVTFNLISIK